MRQAVLALVLIILLSTNAAASPFTVELFRGLGNLGGPDSGIDNLGLALDARYEDWPIHTAVFNWQDSTNSAPFDFLRPYVSDPLVLIGHSFGADSALQYAQELGQAGIKVALAVLLDDWCVLCPGGNTRPSNVARLINLYETNTSLLEAELLALLFLGFPVPIVQQHDILGTQVTTTNINVAFLTDEPVYHATIDDNLDIRNFIMAALDVEVANAIAPQPVPEPATWGLLAMGLLILGTVRKAMRV